MSKNKPSYHLLDIYGAHLHLATNDKAWANLARRHEIQRLGEDADAMGLTQWATWVPSKPAPSEPHLFFWIDLAAHDDDRALLVETCAHEATHGSTHLLKHVGHKFRRHDEPAAYLAGWLARWLFSECLKKADK